MVARGTVRAMTTRPTRLPGQQIACGWCGRSFPLLRTGRLPKWCSDTCRHRAWEQRRAAASGRSAVEVVDRKIEVEKRVTVVERVNVPIAPRRGDWPDVLAELVKQIDSGRVYDRDLRDLAQALDHVLRALASRPCWQRLMT